MFKDDFILFIWELSGNFYAFFIRYFELFVLWYLVDFIYYKYSFEIYITEVSVIFELHLGHLLCYSNIIKILQHQINLFLFPFVLDLLFCFLCTLTLIRENLFLYQCEGKFSYDFSFYMLLWWKSLIHIMYRLMSFAMKLLYTHISRFAHVHHFHVI